MTLSRPHGKGQTFLLTVKLGMFVAGLEYPSMSKIATAFPTPAAAETCFVSTGALSSVADRLVFPLLA